MILLLLYILLGIYLFSVLFFWFYQKQIIFIPGREIFRTPKDEGLEFEDIDLKTPDGLTLNAWYIPNHHAEKSILFCHGNAGSLSSRIDTINLLHEMGFSLFIFDYRGYGISEGTASEQGCYIDSETALAYMVDELRIPQENIIIWGRSLGGPIAAYIAARGDFYATVLESTFTSIRDMAVHKFKILPTFIMTRFRFPTVEYVKQIKSPTLIVHSPDDEIIPYYMGERLFEAASSPKKFLALRGSHNCCYFDSIDIYKKGVLDFLSRQ